MFTLTLVRKNRGEIVSPLKLNREATSLAAAELVITMLVKRLRVALISAEVFEIDNPR